VDTTSKLIQILRVGGEKRRGKAKHAVHAISLGAISHPFAQLATENRRKNCVVPVPATTLLRENKPRAFFYLGWPRTQTAGLAQVISLPMEESKNDQRNWLKRGSVTNGKNEQGNRDPALLLASIYRRLGAHCQSWFLGWSYAWQTSREWRSPSALVSAQTAGYDYPRAKP